MEFFELLTYNIFVVIDIKRFVSHASARLKAELLEGNGVPRQSGG